MDHGVGTDSVEQDIFDVHRALLFSENRTNPLSEDKYLDHSVRTGQCRPRCDFYPFFVIHDDAVEITRFLFGAARFVETLKCRKHENGEDLHFRVEMVIIPESIECVFDGRLVDEDTLRIGYIDRYLLENECPKYTKRTVVKDAHRSAVNVEQTLHRLHSQYLDECPSSDLLFIVDRRSEHQNILYFAPFPDHFPLDILRRKYCLGMSFATFSEYGITRCHLHFGVDRKMRFFPEHSVSVLPVLFRGGAHSERMKEMKYGVEYKHGFALRLKDPLFITEYLRCTEYEHVSVNEHPENPLHDFNALNPFHGEVGCDCDDLELCGHVQRIVSALEEDQPCLEIEALLFSFDHLVRVHGLFGDAVRRRRILQHFNGSIGFCRRTKDCPIYSLHHRGHSLEAAVTVQSDSFLDRRYDLTADIHRDLRQSTLYSMHSHLLHGEDRQYSPSFAMSTAEESKVETHSVSPHQPPPIDLGGIGILKWRWLIEEAQGRIYRSFKEEVIDGRYSTVSARAYSLLLAECTLKAANRSINVEGFTVEQLVALKLYCDTEEYRERLLRALIDDAVDTRDRAEFYWWSTTLYAAYLVAATPTAEGMAIAVDWIAANKVMNQRLVFITNCCDDDGPRHSIKCSIEDLDERVSVLVEALRTKREYITNRRAFYESIGFAVDGTLRNDEQFGTKLMKSPLFFAPTPLEGHSVRDRLVTELKMDSEALTVRKPYGHALDHLVEALISRTEAISDKDAFYKSLGVAVTAYWVFKMAKHGALYRQTAHCQLRVVDRLIGELALRRLERHTAAQRAVLNLQIKYTVFHALKYCVMTIAVDESDDRLVADLTATDFKMQYIYDDDTDDGDGGGGGSEVEGENVVEVLAHYDHEFVFNEDCKFRFYLRNKVLFQNEEWILFRGDAINLSDFCFNELAEHFVFTPSHGIVSLSVEDIPERYLEEILAIKTFNEMVKVHSKRMSWK